MAKPKNHKCKGECGYLSHPDEFRAMAVHHKNFSIHHQQNQDNILHSLVYLTIDFFPVHPIAQTENSIINVITPPCSTPYITTSGINGSYKIKMIGRIFRSILINTTDCQFMLFLSKDNFCPTGSCPPKTSRTKVSETNMLPALCNSSGFPFNTLMPKVRK